MVEGRGRRRGRGREGGMVVVVVVVVVEGSASGCETLRGVDIIDGRSSDGLLLDVVGEDGEDDVQLESGKKLNSSVAHSTRFSASRLP